MCYKGLEYINKWNCCNKKNEIKIHVLGRMYEFAWAEVPKETSAHKYNKIKRSGTG